MLYEDRRHAGRELVKALKGFEKQAGTVVMGLARGGMVVADVVAKGLSLPLDVMVIRKVGAPRQEELAIGAIDEEGEGIFNRELIEDLGIGEEYVREAVEKQKKVAKERAALYRQKSKRIEVKGKTVILVDDGLATGATMRAAIYALRKKGVKKIVVAIPVAAQDSLAQVSKEVDETVCLAAPSRFMAVGQFYLDFDQTSDDDVVRILSK